MKKLMDLQFSLPKRDNSLLWICGLTLVTAGLLSGCGEGQPAAGRDATPNASLQDLALHPVYSTYQFGSPEETIRIGVQPLWVHAANITEAMRRDRLLQQDLAGLGLTAEFYAFLKGPDINWFMSQGQLDVGMGGYLPTLRLSTEIDLLVPSTIDQSYSELVAVNCRTIKDLQGRRIGFPQGSDAHHALAQGLELNGVNAKLVPMDVDRMPEALRTGTIDACMTWEPITSQLLAENAEARMVYRSRWINFVYFRKDFAARQPEAVSAVLAAQARAIRWISDDVNNLRLSSRWAIEACSALSPDSSPPALEDFVKQSRKAAVQFTVPVVMDGELREGGLLSDAFAFLKRERRIPDGAAWERTRTMFDTESMQTILHAPNRWRLNEFDYETGEQP